MTPRRPLAGLAAALIGGVLAWCGGCDANFFEDPDPDDRTEWGTHDLDEAWCVGNGDGEITFDEVVAAPELGIASFFTVNVGGSTAVWDEPSGFEGNDGVWTWDLSATDPAADELLSVGPQALSGLWYESYYPADAFTALLDGPSRMWGVYRLDPDVQALMLLGVAAEDPGDVLVYDPPVPSLRFPLADGDAWSAEDAEAVGVVDGEAYPQDLGPEGIVTLIHTYDHEVVGAGRVMLPIGDLDVVRLQVIHRQEAYNSIAGLFAADSFRATLFVSECLGVVARVRSTTDEVDPEFQDATELLRLGFEPELL